MNARQAIRIAVLRYRTALYDLALVQGAQLPLIANPVIEWKPWGWTIDGQLEPGTAKQIAQRFGLKLDFTAAEIARLRYDLAVPTGASPDAP